MEGILTHGDTDLLEALGQASSPLYVCTIASTETAAIEGLSIAGASAEMRRYTPPADMECLFYGSARSIVGVPSTPDGIPSPVIITMASLAAAAMPFFVVDAGCEVSPQTPYFKLGVSPGRSILAGEAVEQAEALWELGLLLGSSLARVTDYLILGESVPGGTTTALAVMLALGLDAERKVSSTMIGGAHELKLGTVFRAFSLAGIAKGTLAADPLGAVRLVGDPMQAVVAGLAASASREVPVMLAGGTQMATVAALLTRLGVGDPTRICIGTTRWVLADPDADLRSLADQAGCARVYAADLDFSAARYAGMQAYESGLVKEGVGAGGSALAAMTYGRLSPWELMRRIEAVYEKTVLRQLEDVAHQVAAP